MRTRRLRFSLCELGDPATPAHGGRATLGGTIGVTSPEGPKKEITPAAQKGAAEAVNPQRDPAAKPWHSPGDNRLGRLIRVFSNPASQVTGRLVSLLGLLLIAATLVLGVINLLGQVDFVAAMTAGAALSIGGAFALQADYVRSWRAARDAIEQSQETALREAKLQYLNAHRPE